MPTMMPRFMVIPSITARSRSARRVARLRPMKAPLALGFHARRAFAEHVGEKDHAAGAGRDCSIARLISS